MSEKRFTNVSIGMEEAYCDFSIIKVGDKIISDGIPTTDAIGICELLNELNDENKELKLQLEAFKDKLCELGVSDVKLYGKRYYTGLEEWLE